MKSGQNQCSLSSDVDLIPKTDDEEGTTERVESPLNHQGSRRASPSSSEVAIITGGRLRPDRLKTDEIWHRNRRSLPATSRSTMWFVQLSAIVVTLAVAVSVALVCTLRAAEGHSQEDGNTGLDPDMKDDSGAGRNNDTNAVAAAGMSHIRDLATQSADINRAPKAVNLSAEEQITVAPGIAAAANLVVSEPVNPSTYDPFIFPYPAKSSDNATTEKNLSAVASTPKGSSSAVYRFDGKEGKDFLRGLTRRNHHVVWTTGEQPLGVARSSPRLVKEEVKAIKRTRRLFRLDRKAWVQERDLRFWKRKSVV